MAVASSILNIKFIDGLSNFNSVIEVEDEESAVVRCSIEDGKDAALWLEEFQIKSKTGWCLRNSKANPLR